MPLVAKDQAIADRPGGSKRDIFAIAAADRECKSGTWRIGSLEKAQAVLEMPCVPKSWRRRSAAAEIASRRGKFANYSGEKAHAVFARLCP